LRYFKLFYKLVLSKLFCQKNSLRMKAIFNSSFTEVNKENRKTQQKLSIIRAIAQSGSGITVPEICKMLKISAPTGFKLVNELQTEGFLGIVGKKETHNGRKPAIYDLKNVRFYAISVEILLKRISVGIIDSQLDTVYCKNNTEFVLENTADCLKEVEKYITACVRDSGISKDHILGMGMGITGRVMQDTGESLTYFNFMDLPLGKYFSKLFDIPVFINNDTRCFGQAEKIIGKAKHVNHAIVINLSRGLGTSLIIDNRIVNGGNGFAGEMGHMQFGNRENMCICGKKGCLGNDVGGYALEEKFMDCISRGEKSIIQHPGHGRQIRYDGILQAALEGDELSIRLVQEMGFKLGNALGNIINLLNPELVIIAGKFASAKDILLDPLKSGITSSALINPLRHCHIAFSELGHMGGLKGAGALVFEYFELIKQ